MSPDADQVKAIYSGAVAARYDFKMPPFFKRWKRLAVEASSLKRGDRVLVFCCGTGLDFPCILERIGPEGSLVGVDFSAVMLEGASARIRKQGWQNVELVEADVTRFGALDPQADAGVCTLGLSIIPDWLAGYRNLLASVKPGGEVIVGDMQLASGWRAKLNPVTILMARKFGGSHEGHGNSLKLQETITRELEGVRRREFFLGAYFYCIGVTPATPA